MAQTMPPPRTGSIRRKQTKLGTSYGLRFKYQGQEHYHHIGGSWEGWTEERVDDERRYVMARRSKRQRPPGNRSLRSTTTAPGTTPIGDAPCTSLATRIQR